MNRILSQVLIFLGLLAALTIIKFPYNEYVELFFRGLKKEARSYGLLISYSNPSFSFPLGATVNDLSVVINKTLIPLPFFAQRVALHLPLSSLLMLKTEAKLAAEAYTGKLESSFSSPFWGGQQNISARIIKLNLIEHPLAKANGISGELSSSLNFSFTEISFLTPPRSLSDILSKFNTGSVKLSLKDAAFNPSFPFKVYGLFPIPSAAEINLEIEAIVKEFELQLNRCELLSSLGSASCIGTIGLDLQTMSPSLNIQIELHLTAEGVEQIAPYLDLASGGNNKNKKDWQITIEKEFAGRKPITKVMPL